MSERRDDYFIALKAWIGLVLLKAKFCVSDSRREEEEFAGHGSLAAPQTGINRQLENNKVDLMQIYRSHKSARGQWGGEVQRSAPIREPEWPLVWNNQRRFCDICTKIYSNRVTLAVEAQSNTRMFIWWPDIDLNLFLQRQICAWGSVYTTWVWYKDRERTKPGLSEPRA